MDKSASDEMQELEERHNQVKDDIAIYKDKLIVQRSRLLAEYDHYEYLENELEKLYDMEGGLADELARFKLRNDLY